MRDLCKDTRGVLKEQEGRGGRSSLEFGDSFDDGTSLVIRSVDRSIPVSCIISSLLLCGEAPIQVHETCHCSLQWHEPRSPA